MSRLQKLSDCLADPDNLPKVYALAVCLLAVAGLCTVMFIPYHEDPLYPKVLHPDSPLYPYDRGGVPFEEPGTVIAQYPENSPAIGYVTSYLTPAAVFLTGITPHIGTSIVAHPGGILDEILYSTRGLDTIVEAGIFFTAFAIASFLYRREE
jgi:energy-converting hydrogenase A subunit F